MDVQVVSSQGQNGSVKTDGAFLPRVLLSGFLLVSIMGYSAFPGLQTSVRRGTSLLYSAPTAAALRCRHSRCAGLRSVLGTRVGPPNLGQKGSWPCLLCSESCHAEVPAKPLHRPQESLWRPRVVPPLGIFCSMSDQNLSEVWHPLVLCALTESCNPELLSISHLGSFPFDSIFFKYFPPDLDHALDVIVML